MIIIVNKIIEIYYYSFCYHDDDAQIYNNYVYYYNYFNIIN